MNPDLHDDFLRLLLQHQPELHGFLLARGIATDQVDDVLQEIATILWRRFHEFEHESNFRAWSFAVARNVLMKKWDQQKKDSRLLQLDANILSQVDNALENQQCDYTQLHFCLDRLGTFAQRLVRVYYYDGLNYDEVSDCLNVKSASIRVRMHRIRKALHTCMQQQGAQHG